MGMGRITSATALNSVSSSLLQTQSEKQSDELAEQIEKNDTDKSGTLSKDEFISMSKKNSEENEACTKLAETLFDTFDSDNDGELTEKEIEDGRENLANKLGTIYSSSGIKSRVNTILGTTESTSDDSTDDKTAALQKILNSSTNGKNIQKYLEQAKLSGNSEYSNVLLSAALNSGSTLIDYL